MMQTSWLVWALLSAVFAAMTAILAKLGVAGVNSDLATFVRTVVVVVVLGALLLARGQMSGLVSGLGALSSRTLMFLTLSGLATGASWLCYFRALQLGEASRVAPIDKLSVVLVAVFGVTLLGERLSGLGWLGVALIAAGALLVAVA